MTFTSWQFGIFVGTVFGAYYFPALRTLQIQLLVIASLFFYGYGQPALLPLLAVAVFGTYLFLILALRNRRIWLPLGIAFNLALLAFFKYKFLLIEPSSSDLTGVACNGLPPEVAATDRDFVFRIPQYQLAGRSDQARSATAESDKRLSLHHLLSAACFGTDHARRNVHAADQAEIFFRYSIRRGREVDFSWLLFQALRREQPQ
jgi:hypothetical protein